MLSKLFHPMLTGLGQQAARREASSGLRRSVPSSQIAAASLLLFGSQTDALQ